MSGSLICEMSPEGQELIQRVATKVNEEQNAEVQLGLVTSEDIIEIPDDTKCASTNKRCFEYAFPGALDKYKTLGIKLIQHIQGGKTPDIVYKYIVKVPEFLYDILVSTAQVYLKCDPKACTLLTGAWTCAEALKQEQDGHNAVKKYLDGKR